MAKVRVYELAKQLGVETKEVVAALAAKGIEVKSQNSIEDDAIAIVENKFKKSTANAETAPSKDVDKDIKKETEKKDAPKTESVNSEKKEDGARPKKKSSISAVFNAQYSKQQPRQRRDGDRPRRRNDGERSNGERSNNNRSDRSGAARPTQGRITIRPESERTVRPSHRVQEEKERQERLERKERQERQERQERREGGNNNRNNQNQNRPIRPREMSGSDRPSSRVNNGENRRPRNNDGNRNNNYNNNRTDRPNGGNRPNNGNSSFGDNRRNNAAPTAPAADMRQKESRDRDNNRNNKKKHDYDQLGSKKQERYVNLEKNGGKKKNKAPQQKPVEKDPNEIRTLTLPEHITIKELADKMKVQASVIVKKLFMKGVMVTVNQDVDYEQAEEIALEFNCICEPEVKVDVIEELLREDEEAADDMVARPPVVCVMGHVDHGKTSLLDAIRDTKVTDREAGGITQHIGAYMVSINGQKITFLDTPGHEAFTAMRMRGANSTDIAILVVAADDGVMPQTVEAINHAKAAGIEIIVAINKIDKPNANVDRVKQELSEYELIPEDWGGSTIFVPVSAHTHEGIDELLEMILLTAEVLELKANPKRNARGLVIEAQLDKGRGAVATVLVQKGTLHVGDPIAAGSSYGRVRAMIDENGRRVKVATPSTPVEILGLSDVPNAGEIFVSMDSEKEARNFAETFISEGKNKLIEDTKTRMSLDDLFSQIQSGNVKELNIIVKADVQGSVEAVKQSLVKLSNDEVVVKIIHGGVGAINESDVILASASNAIIIGFNVRPDAMAKATADREGVDVRLYKVIYSAIEDVEAAMKGMLDPVYEEKVIGHAQVRQIFKASDVGNIAGSYVLDGYFQRGCKVRVSREGEQIFEGDLASLKRFKDDVKEVKAGFECGLVVDGFNDIVEDDVIEAYIMVEVPR